MCLETAPWNWTSVIALWATWRERAANFGGREGGETPILGPECAALMSNFKTGASLMYSE